MAQSRRIRSLVFSVLAVCASSCGVSEDEAVLPKEGESLSDAPYCGSFGCVNPYQFCAEIFLEFGRSPPICVFDDICERLECANSNRTCALFDGFPAQVKCIKP
ncbi:hypothetical protein BHS06_30660 [Myxococcus xanthus]|uniref:hypothetical protein n=1 Tax=Myxococcus xanthus TaxID=34 RepID=UPI00112B4E84|nr:hypothetical protein [Myxococcus xanthus]QDE92992.1 hypothetical protein BHS06_30660 [Myxococcus xanthus]